MTKAYAVAVLVGALVAAAGLLDAATAQAATTADESPVAPGPAPVVVRDLRHDQTPPLASMVSAASAAPSVQPLRPRLQLPGRSTTVADEGPAAGSSFVETATYLAGALSGPIRSFEGVSNSDNANATGYLVLPPDPNGDVGPNHYVQWVNLSLAIWDKSGRLLYGPVAGNALWAGFGEPCETSNDGDPIALYDGPADRWVMSQFALPNFPDPPFYQCVAVSQTPDPTGAWYRYAFTMTNDKMNDYTKLAVWPDGYYLSVNQFQPVTGGLAWGGGGAIVMEREKMLAGLEARMVLFDLYDVNRNFGGMLPSHLNGPAPPEGSPNYFMEVDDAAWGSFDTDSLRIWQFHVDWTNPVSSTFGLAGQPNAVLDTDPFSANILSITQPGDAPGLDTLSDRLMYRLQYRNFGDHESLLANHTVRVGTRHAGIRWYEVRDPGGTPAIYQQGTHSPDSDSRWMGSIAMDGQGNIALGYSVASSTLYPSIRYTGRFAADPLGTMPQGERELMRGHGAQLSTRSRWGDYSSMSIDPVDDRTFWYTQEYYATTSDRGWRTRIGSFTFLTYTSTLPVLSKNTPTDYSAMWPQFAAVTSLWDSFFGVVARWLGL